MDREFMRSFCRNYYSDFETEAIKDSEEYQERRKQRYETERKLELKLQESGEEIQALFEQYLDACADELEILLEEMYVCAPKVRCLI